MSLVRYLHTIWYLKPIQIFGRIWFWVHRPTVRAIPALPVRRHSGRWRQSPLKPRSLLSPSHFRFLNEEHELLSAADWNNPTWDKLWLYHLHYFDDLNAGGGEERSDWHRALIARWVAENPVGKGNGWEPYPLSLRIVNWVKWAWAGNELSGAAVESLALQARFLLQRLEWHILGNHLLANAKALIFAGLFFEGAEAEKWLATGLSILDRELPEQILADGGHFERSPMYHAQVMEDVLDVVNAYGMLDSRFRGNDKCGGGNDTCGGGNDEHGLKNGEFESSNEKLQPCSDKFKELLVLAYKCRVAMPKMLGWLGIMTHPDGEIALFNDAAFGGAAAPAALAAYAEHLGIGPGRLPELADSKSETVRLTHLEATGYVRVDCGEMAAFLDVAPIGPDYLPGHAHADTLSFELTLGRQRVIVDSGVSRYGEGPERLRLRGTAAHNTVEINGQNSSEVWGGFRVARRAYPRDLRIHEKSGIETNFHRHKDGGGAPLTDGESAPDLVVSCAHDGYRRLPGKPVHRRECRFRKGSLQINDEITGRFKKALGRFHFHPDIKIIPSSDDCTGGKIVLPEGREIAWRIGNGRGSLSGSTWHPEFDISLPNMCLEVHFMGLETLIEFSWK